MPPGRSGGRKKKRRLSGAAGKPFLLCFFQGRHIPGQLFDGGLQDVQAAVGDHLVLRGGQLLQPLVDAVQLVEDDVEFPLHVVFQREVDLGDLLVQAPQRLVVALQDLAVVFQDCAVAIQNLGVVFQDGAVVIQDGDWGGLA